MKQVFQWLLACGMLLNTAMAQQPAAVIPAFTFFKFDQSAFTNANLSKTKQHFFVFFDTECDHCQHAITYLNGHYKQLANVSLYLISLDPPAKVNPFLQRYGSQLRLQKNVLLLQDKHDEFIRKFTPKKYPSLFLYGANQRLIFYSDDEQQLPVLLQKIK